MIKDTELFKQFIAFSVEHKRSGDIDPVYLVLRQVHKIRGYDLNEAIWHTLLYVTWYHLGSGEIMKQRHPMPEIITTQPKLNTGVERRGFRGNTKGCELLSDVMNSWRGESMTGWLRGLCCANDPKTRWNMIRDDFAKIKYNGVWASYKWCDLVKNVLGFPITSPDIGVGGGGENAGPVPGLVRLTGLDWKRCARDIDLQQKFYEYCKNAGIPWDGLEEMETALCDFNTHKKGHYYVGHDIDLMMQQVAGIPGENDYWQARAEAFREQYLGENNGWFGVRKGRHHG
jgi:hypothetical protein